MYAAGSARKAAGSGPARRRAKPQALSWVVADLGSPRRNGYPWHKIGPWSTEIQDFHRHRRLNMLSVGSTRSGFDFCTAFAGARVSLPRVRSSLPLCPFNSRGGSMTSESCSGCQLHKWRFRRVSTRHFVPLINSSPDTRQCPRKNPVSTTRKSG